MAKFRLASLHKLRERERDIAANAVQEVRMALEKLDERQREIEESNRLMDACRKQASTGAIQLQQILDAQRFQMVLAAQAAQIAEQQKALRPELEQRQIALLKCQQAVKSLDKLREQGDEAARTLELGKQQQRLDEWSSVRYAIKSQP